MDNQEFRIFETKLTERAVEEIEGLMEHECFRNCSKLKRSVALMVVLTYEPNQDKPFFQLHKRLASLFTSLTSAHQGQEPRISFRRPIIRRNQGLIIMDEMVEQCLCTWLYDDLAVSVDIPNNYNKGFQSSMMYMIVADIHRYFSARFEDPLAAVEIPCFLDTFLISSVNNQGNLGALVGEYVALNGICFESQRLEDNYSYSCETYKFDFAINDGTQETKVSVKSVNFSPVQHFENPRGFDLWDPNRTCDTAKMVRVAEGENVLLHSCDCEPCTRGPLQRIVIRQSMITGNAVSLETLECERRETFEKVITNWLPKDAFVRDSDSNSTGSDESDDEDSDDGDEDQDNGDPELVVVTLVAARMFFELRYALCSFQQNRFRHPMRFRLRENLIGSMGQIGPTISSMPGLIDRSAAFQ
ncbi:hypothetical protein BOX15_Mlig025917g2 [Macrostomum lignano]|uniref:Uncharacterized protein n=1 Tax=Macrostomum lignano TaxID=282301 RepID=A0A267GCF6_9PLAT|nr:hypothetical protein BOX15_Mlig025917g3 [Macrostomum lignano]PAA58225.1 hypothetical protein BOX15_Mlig025917g1 [Macrostomum lignano]PAA83711.1 hypothetical protein BOX15_Mlig025917g2 [Macrostomum lignano]